MQIQRKKHLLNCCIIWSILIGLFITIFLVLFVLDSQSISDKIDYYSSITMSWLIYYYHCDGSFCSGKYYQSSNRYYCCDVNNICNLKSSCLDEYVQNLKDTYQQDVMVIYIASAVLVVFLALSISCCYSQNKAIRNHQNNSNSANRLWEQAGQGQTRSRPRKGVEVQEKRQALIESFSYYDLENTCCICLQAFTQQQKAAILACGHFFHSKCIKDWTAVSKQCPICRRTKDSA